MSETKLHIIPEETVKKLKFISKHIKKLNVGNGKEELWLATEGDGGYDWSQFDVGINSKGELMTCFQSGCSCNGPEEPTAETTYLLEGNIRIENDSYYDTGAYLPELMDVASTLYDVLKKKTVEAEKIIKLPNAEVRRAVIEFIGMDKFIKDANPAVLDTNEVHGELLQLKLEEDEAITLLHVKDPSTDREYFLRVPPEMKNAAQARAWTLGFNEKDFILIKET